MATHFFAIDETGSFTLNPKDNSFACGVPFCKDENALREIFKNGYEKKFGNLPVKNDAASILKTGDTANFHFAEMNDELKTFFERTLPSVSKKIYRSTGKPVLYANNQNWWLVAVTVVIQKFLNEAEFEKNDEVKIFLDNRNDITFGVMDYEKTTENFIAYHDLLKSQILASCQKIADSRSVKIEIVFSSDAVNFFIAAADIFCGFVKNKLMKDKIISCPCSDYANGKTPDCLPFIYA